MYLDPCRKPALDERRRHPVQNLLLWLLLLIAFLSFVGPAGWQQQSTASAAEFHWALGTKPSPDTAAGAPPALPMPTLVLPAGTDSKITFNAGFHFGEPTTCNGSGALTGSAMARSAGLDFGIGNNKAVSMGPGEVSFVGWLDDSFGWSVVIELVDPSGTRTGWAIQYSHLAEPGVGTAPSLQINQRINRGAFFAIEGNSGTSAEHLHVHFLAHGKSYLPEGITIEGWQFWPAYQLNADQEPTGIYPYEGSAIQGTPDHYEKGRGCATNGYYKVGSSTTKTIIAQDTLREAVGGGGGDGDSSVKATLEDFSGSPDKLLINLGEEIADLGPMNDRASIVNVPSGSGIGELVCYTEKNFVGTPYRFGPGRTYTLTGFQDNVLSSCRFERSGTPTPADTSITSGPASCVGTSSVAFSYAATGGNEFSTQLNNGEWSPFNGSSSMTLTGLGTGDFTFRVKARGGGGEDPTPATQAFSVDVTRPTIALSQTGAIGLRGWFIGPMTPATSASVTDVGCGSSSLVTTRSVDGAPPSPYQGAIVAGLGRHSITIVSTDAVGNRTSESITANWDNSAPSTGNKLNVQKTTLPDGRGRVLVTYEVTCSDLESGCWERSYGSLKTGPWTKFTTPVVLEDKTLACGEFYSRSFTVSYFTWAENEAGLKSNPVQSWVSQSVSHQSVMSGCGSSSTPTPPGCVISSNITSLTLTGGSSLTASIKTKSVGGMTSPVTLTVAGYPTGITGTLSPSVVTPTTLGATSSLRLQASQPPAAQSRVVTVSGVSSSGITCTPASITIRT